MAEDEIMEDVDTTVDEGNAVSKDAVNVEKLLNLLDIIKSAGDVIAGKDVMLLIGLTGAGKTTSTLYLAGAEFEEEEVDGYAHYKPTKLPSPDLSEFAVSGSACSVTKAIHATTIFVEGENGQKEAITVCDTPGFGDTKGPEMEISNGLGIIHALKRARSIKIVVVLDHRTMDGSRWMPLRKNLSTIIAMMGRESLDFSTFSYIFTRCEGKSQKRISKQLDGFGKVLRTNPAGILGDNLEDKEILEAFVADMVSKTKPEDVNCIDPEEPEEAPGMLKKLWSGGRIENPAEAFVNFCSKESLSALLLQVSSMLGQLDSSFQAADLGAAERCLDQMIRMDNALSLPEVKEAVEKGRNQGRNFVEQIVADIKHLAKQMGNPSLPHSEFEEKLNALPPKLELLAKTNAIGSACGMNANYDTLLEDITSQLFLLTRRSVCNTNAGVGEKGALLQRALMRFASIAGTFQSILASEVIQTECSQMFLAVEDEINPFLAEVKKSLVPDPTIESLVPQLDNLAFLLEMQGFFRASTISLINLEDAYWDWFTNGLDDIIQSVTTKSASCALRLEEVVEALQDLLGDPESWSTSELLKLTESSEYKAQNDFLMTIMSSRPLLDALSNESTPDFLSITNAFDTAIGGYLSELAEFIKRQTQSLYDNKAEVVSNRVMQAKEMLELLTPIMVATETLQGSNCRELKDFSNAKGKLEVFVEESKKSRGHGIQQLKKLEPTPEELARATTAVGKRGLASWYKMCAELRVYWKKNGHCNVPQRDPKNPKLAVLGRWAHAQRKAKKKYELGSKTAMTDEKLQHLADMDFQWDPKKIRDDQMWNQRFQELIEYKEENGHCNVPQKYKEVAGLARWVNTQRVSYTRKQQTAERIERLNSIGFQWSAKH